MTRETLAVIVVLLLIGCSAHVSEHDITSAEAIYVAAHKMQQTSPEQTLRLFFEAFLNQDAVSIKKLTIERPHLEVLWNDGSPLPHSEVITVFFQQPLRRVNVGETLFVSTTQRLQPIIIDENQVNDGRQMLLLGEHPIPWILVKIDGQWYVDPAPFIAAALSGQQ